MEKTTALFSPINQIILNKNFSTGDVKMDAESSIKMSSQDFVLIFRAAAEFLEKYFLCPQQRDDTSKNCWIQLTSVSPSYRPDVPHSPAATATTGHSPLFVEMNNWTTMLCFFNTLNACTTEKHVWMNSRAVLPDLAKFRHFGNILQVFWHIFDSLFLIWQNFEPTLGNLAHYWANFYCC